MQLLLHILRDQAQADHLQARRAGDHVCALQREKRVDGLFLSSGIVPDADTTMEKMLATVERLRLREGYTGYIHLKLIPGADFEYIERAVELDLRRASFSAFHPIERSPFADEPAEDPTRALRLYQSDLMIRDYGFGYADLPFDEIRRRHAMDNAWRSIPWQQFGATLDMFAQAKG